MVAVDKDSDKNEHYGNSGKPIIVEPRLWYQTKKSADIEQQEQHKGIEKHENRRCANLVKSGCKGHRQAIDESTNANEQ